MSGTPKASPAALLRFNTLCQIDPSGPVRYSLTCFALRRSTGPSSCLRSPSRAFKAQRFVSRTAHFPQKNDFLGTSFASILLCVLNPRAAMPAFAALTSHRRADYFLLQLLSSSLIRASINALNNLAVFFFTQRIFVG